MKRPIHASHRMSKSFTDVRAPAGTPRFYGVRRCRGCGGEEIVHAAGQFTDEALVKPCTASAKTPKKRLKPRTRKVLGTL